MIGGTGVRTVDDCRIAYRRAGTDGPPVVLLHGAGVDDATVSWRHTIGALADADFRVYAPDWPGYGNSDNGVTHDIDSYVDVLESFLDVLGDESPILVGISMGGGVALGYALRHPERVRALCLVDSYGLGDRIPAGPLWRATAQIPGANALGWAAMGYSTDLTRLALGTIVADASALPADFVHDVYASAREPGAGLAFEAFQRNELGPRGRPRTDFSDRLGEVSAPTLFVHGRADPLFPVEWSKRAASRVPDAELRVLPKCGHWPPRERPEPFNDALQTYLEDQR